MTIAEPKPAMPATARHEHDWRLPPLFMLRVAGLPYEAVAPLRAARAVGWADRVLALEAELDGLKESAAAGLEAAVGAEEDGGARRRLLNLRRDVHNRRLPRDPAGAITLADRLAPEAAAALTGWLDRRERYERERGEGAETLAADLADGRRHLRSLAEDPRLRLGVLLASPSVDRYLPTYLRADGAKLSKRARRIERSLSEYVYRTACKTSPFSTLTTVQLGRFENGVPAAIELTDPGRGRRSFARLNVVTLARLGELLCDVPELRRDLPVHLTSGWRIENGRIRYVRRLHRLGDDSSAMTLDLLEENLFYLSRGDLLAELTARLPAGAEPVPFGDLVTALQRGGSEARDRGDVESYLARLLRLGLLSVPLLHLDIHHPDPVRDMHDRFAGLGRPWADALAERLAEVTGLVDAYPDADLDGRRDLVVAIKAELEEAQHDLGRAEATTPRTLVYEDVTQGAAARADLETWSRSLVPSLEGLCRILPVFDLTLPNRLAARGFFRARYGAGGTYPDVIRFAHEFHQDCYEQFIKVSMMRRPFGEDGEYVAQQNWFKMPEVDALDDAQRHLTARMRELAAALPDDAAELRLDDALVDEVADRVAPATAGLSPRSFFLQVAERDGRPLGVVNRAYSGLTLLFSRFGHCFPDDEGHGLADGLRAALADLQPPGTVFAELTGGLEATNLNLHPAVMPYELVCPGDTSARPADEQVPVDDLVVRDDQEAGELVLWSERLGKRVVPVYLGFLLPLALPELQRVLLTFGYSNMAARDLWAGVPERRGPGGLYGRPRITYGDLVVQRRTWRLPADLPDRAATDDDASWFLAWQRLFREHDLPRRAFLSRDLADDDEAATAIEPDTAGPDGAEPERADGDPGRADGDAGRTEGRPTLSKPLYVDRDSWFSLVLVDAAVKDGGRFALTEMLPAGDDLWLRTGEGSHVTELTVELDGVPRRPGPSAGPAAEDDDRRSTR